jgi:hypothetical protein
LMKVKNRFFFRRYRNTTPGNKHMHSDHGGIRG